MTPGVRPLIAGNWKMHGTSHTLSELDAIAAGFDTALQGRMDALICLPATLISRGTERLEGSAVLAGGQDCHSAPTGAHTGDISAEMIADAGGKYVIVGHSERRADHGENNEAVRAKAEAAARAGLTAIICVGETKDERESGRALEVIADQLAGSLPDSAGFVVAYEPVWAIGTGLTPTAGDVAEVHASIRERLASTYGKLAELMRILYGGSVKPANAAELLSVANVDGALIGGASLKSEDFLGICRACH